MHIFSTTFTHILASLINLTGDWFVAVALVTFGIKILLFPLAVKQQRTQLLLNNLNQTKSILANKFRNQAEKVDSRLLKIVSKYKINPLLSFIPFLIQAPIFFSLYFSVLNLSTSVGSVLLPWISSLHSMDSFHVLPVIAGLLQGLSGFFMENRNLLFFIVPIAIGVAFLWKAPAALSAYWIVSSVFRFVEIKIFSINHVKQKLLNIPSPEEMIESTV